MKTLIGPIWTGLLCGMWAAFGGMAELSVWAGFAGCTAYFASGKQGLQGIILTLTCSFFGALCGLAMLKFGGVVPSPIVGNWVGVGVLVALIVAMGRFKAFAFIPGSFVGCYSFFGLLGESSPTVFSGATPESTLLFLMASLIAGTILGFLCDWGGRKLTEKFYPEAAEESQTAT